MADFIMKYGSTIIICLVLAAIVVAIIAKLRRDRKKGKHSCGCGCENCTSSGICHSDKK